jgi:DNA-binding response OmpR family regulator
MKPVLESKGYKVIAAYDREEVMKVWKKCKPDLIFLEADDFMKKPVASATLVGRIDKLLKG